MPDAELSVPFVMSKSEAAACEDLLSLSKDPNASPEDVARWYYEYTLLGCSIIRLTRILWGTFGIEVL